MTETTTPAELEQLQRVISRMCADRVVVLSQQPFDVRNASVWPTLIELFEGLTRYFAVEVVTRDELAELPRTSRLHNVSLLLPAEGGGYQREIIIGVGADMSRLREAYKGADADAILANCNARMFTSH